MTIRGIDDIEREGKRRERETFKAELVDDVDDFFKDVFDRINKRKEEEKIRRNKDPLKKINRKIMAIISLVILYLFFVNFVLLNIWLFKFFIKSLLGVG